MIDLNEPIEPTTNDSYPFESLSRLAPAAPLLRGNRYVYNPLVALAPNAPITERCQPR